MTVDDVVAKVHVAGKTEEEQQELREHLRQVLFAERSARRRYFSSKRIGRAAGVPPASFEETEEFRRSGRAPPSQAPRPTTGDQGKAQDDYVRDLSEQGQLVPSASPFGAAVVMVRKASGGWRMAFDYSDTNDVLVKQHYSLKSIQGFLDQLAHSKWLSAVDMIAAFWQTPVEKGSRKYTAVNFASGKMEFTTLPMGMQAARRPRAPFSSGTWMFCCPVCSLTSRSASWMTF